MAVKKDLNNINTMVEKFDEDVGGMEVSEKLTKEEILQSESDILAGLLELGNTRNNPEEYHKIQIRREGKVKLEFRIRPLSEKEMIGCNEQATKYAPPKGGKPRTALKTDVPKMRSLFIYTATVDEDRKKIWDNEQAKLKFNILESADMIDMVLKGGEKDQILAKIDEISGYHDDIEVMAKNS